MHASVRGGAVVFDRRGDCSEGHRVASGQDVDQPEHAGPHPAGEQPAGRVHLPGDDQPRGSSSNRGGRGTERREELRARKCGRKVSANWEKGDNFC